MALLVDTSVLIQAERHGLSLDALPLPPDEPVCIAAITASELLHGLYRANSPMRRLRRERLVEALLEALPVIPVDLHVARTHAALWADLAGCGQPIGAHDLLIAATALARGAGVLTANERDFGRVPELRVISLPPAPPASR